ncbi:hypothetical protein [Streptomyces sp. NPDC006134]|uniref:hypothetical protein n=1 Tax=Streptomyces sp. NPDC006134 TaxID=3154467 RepID=UPI0033FEF863
MNSLKAAAVLAGSVVLAGTATPAFAHNDLTKLTHSLDSAARVITERPVLSMPVQPRTEALSTENKGSALHTTKGVTNQLNEPGALLGGLPPKG